MDTLTQRSRPFFHSGHSLRFSKKGKGGPPHFPPSCTPVSVAKYASISFNIPTYNWKCLNKLSSLWQSSEYTWSYSWFDRFLKMPWVLNVPGFWTWHSFICKGYMEFWTCLNMFSMPGYTLMSLNMSEHG